MDLRLSFNEDVKNYDKWRPRYTPALFRSIIDFAGLNSVSRALEIGIGTGQATQPFLETGCHVTAIELGSDLAQYTRNKFRSYPNLEVLQKDFEQYESKKNQFDLVYSGTAFHWIPAETGYSKAFGLLKPGGTLALFWNHPFVSRTDDPLHQKIRAAYRRHRPSDNPDPTEFSLQDCEKQICTLRQYGFTLCQLSLFYAVRYISAEGYVALMNTYSDHRAMEQKARLDLEQEIAEAIRSEGGTLKIYDTMDLYLARKPGRFQTVYATAISAVSQAKEGKN